MPTILDKDFKYTPSGKTDIRRLFARIRKQQAADEAAREAAKKPTQLLQYRKAAK